MSDAVAAFEREARASRARMAEFKALTQRAMEFDPISDMVTVRFDGDGYLVDLFIDPTAPTRYTHTELEDLITEVLRDGYARMGEAVRRAFHDFFADDLY